MQKGKADNKCWPQVEVALSRLWFEKKTLLGQPESVFLLLEPVGAVVLGGSHCP